MIAAVPAYAEAPVSSDSVSTYIVVFNDTPGIQAASSKNAVSSFASSSGGVVKYQYHVLNGMAVTIPDSAANQLSQFPNVKYVEKDGRCSVLLNQAVPQIGADQVWAGGYDGTGIKVAVIDTGINGSHPDLVGKVVAWADFVNGNNATPYDDHSHGTHCAGIVAGTGIASSGLIKGVAPGASLMGVKVLDLYGDGWNSDIIMGMDWAVDNGADVLSMSFGSSNHYQTMDDAVSRAVARGVTVVVAAGNSGPSNGTINCPGDSPDAITVGAVDKSDVIASFSSRGPNRDGRIKPDVTNVGVNIISARAFSSPGNYYAVMSGTSMATPMTAGVVALMLQRDNTLTPAQVKERLNRTSKNLGVGVPNNFYGWGRVQAYNAVFNISGNGTVTLNKTAFTASETAGDVIIGVVRYGDGLGPATVDYNISGVTAISGRDYIAANGTLAFGPNETFKTFSVTLLNDNLYVGNRLVNLNLTNPTGNASIYGNANGTLVITDDDLLRMQFNLTNYTVVEGGIAYLNVTRDNDALGTYQVHLATSDISAISGTDYLPVSTNVTFSQGEMFRLIPVTTSQDGLYWDQEKQFKATLTTTGDGATLGTNAIAYVNLTQIDPMPVIQLNATSYSVSETGGFGVINVTRSNNSINDVTINYTTSDGTAMQGINYGNTTGVLTFHQGEMWKFVNVPVYRDDLYSGPLTFTFSLSDMTIMLIPPPQLPPPLVPLNLSATITISNADPAPVIQFASPSYRVDDQNASVDVIVTRVNDASAPVTVQYHTSDGTATAGLNYTDTNGILTFSQGEMSRIIQVPLINSPMAAGSNATFNVTLSDPSTEADIGVPDRAEVTIVNSTYTFTHDLNSGWNLISFPVLPENTNITSLIPADARSHIFVVWMYNGSGTWKYWTELPGYTSTLGNVDAQHGYLVWCDSAISFNVTGKLPESDLIPLKSGDYNVIGYPRFDTVDPADMYGDTLVVWGYKNGTWSFYTTIPGYTNTLASLEPGYGYEVYK